MPLSGLSPTGASPVGTAPTTTSLPNTSTVAASVPPAPSTPPAGLYDVIGQRRDVRGQFTGAPVPDAVLRRVLTAAHCAPSVGLSQPWDFVLVEDPATKAALHAHVQAERAVFAATLDGEQAGKFAHIKIDGVLESTLSLVVTYDAGRGAPAVLGRHAIADAGLYSVCLAIQNLWLAATAEGLGLGWVSFYREEFVRDLLAIPGDVRPVAWLCLGPVTHLETVPDLERHDWARRRPLDDVIRRESWHGQGLGPPGFVAEPVTVGARTAGDAIE